MQPETQSPRRVRGVLLASIVASIGVILTWVLVWTEIHSEPADVHWTLFAVIALLLLYCDRSPRTWIRFGPVGVVTPRWMFAYALMLLGSPSAAVGVALIGATIHTISNVTIVSSVVLRVGGTAVSLSAAALLLSAMRVRGAIVQADSIPWEWGVAIVLASMIIVLLNAVVAALAMSIQRKVSYVILLRRGLAMRITAEGAMLSLAPLWVIGIDFSLVLIPLLGITTVLVFRSTKQALERSHEAHHDALTGLPNRRAFLDNLNNALNDRRDLDSPSLLVMDLNGFKDINDRLGHQIGDALLVAFADRLVTSLPSESTTARLGGDEFAVLMPNLTDDNLVDELHKQLSEPLTVEGFPVSVGVSIGVATAPTDGKTTRDLLQAADVAMYKAKRCGTAVERYDNCLKAPQRGRLNILGDLSEALSGHQLHIHFQPQLKMSDGSVDTVEALIRWNHPTHGSIPPSEFIGLAEQTDLIGPITELVLRVATKGLLTAGDANVKLAVNVSARSLEDPYFAAQVFTILAENGFPASRLELEVTERAIVSNVERTTYTIDRLREAGIRIAIDDFGVGYSSYQTLRLLDVDRVKIDRDFVADLIVQPRDRLIVASLIKLAHELGLDVVAEGVETTEIWDELALMHCDIAQGFGIVMPMAFPDLRGWLSQWNEVLIEEIRPCVLDAENPVPAESQADAASDGSGSRIDALLGFPHR
jgi:diguanylate cyclase (GGDEF)-like protein